MGASYQPPPSHELRLSKEKFFQMNAEVWMKVGHEQIDRKKGGPIGSTEDAFLGVCKPESRTWLFVTG